MVNLRELFEIYSNNTRAYYSNKYGTVINTVVIPKIHDALLWSRTARPTSVSQLCRQVDIEGASGSLAAMRQKGYGVNENIFNILVKILKTLLFTR